MGVELVARDENEQRINVAGGYESIDRELRSGVLRARVNQAGEKAEHCKQQLMAPIARRAEVRRRRRARGRRRNFRGGSGGRERIRLGLWKWENRGKTN